MKLFKQVFFTLSIGLLLASCGSDDDSTSTDDQQGGSNCIELVSQVAQGNFRGEAFVSNEGYYTPFTSGSETTYTIKLFVKTNLESDCFFPTFEGTQDVILFSISSLDNQSFEVSDTSGSSTLNFNRIADGVTEIELAECGTIEITGFNAGTGELQGNVVARGQEGSIVNGDFTLELCEF